jgi:NAD(P)-dependent dehydrogenase (short-subunit alcohol dehydrogenase family)
MARTERLGRQAGMSDQQVVLVTGCSSGFGELISKTSARAGYRVFATMRSVGDRNSQAAINLEAWAQAEGMRLSVVEMDVAETASVQDAVEGCCVTLGALMSL